MNKTRGNISPFLNFEDIHDSELDNKCSEYVVKTNKLVMAIQKLTTNEVRLLQLAIIGAREVGDFRPDQPIRVSADSFAKTFKISKQGAFDALKEAEDRLFNRRFRFLEDGDEVKSQWVTRVKYLNGESAIELVLASDVVNEITNVDGYENFFTKYRLAQTSGLKSVYSVRLYELMAQWKTAKKTPIFKLEVFRAQLGIEEHEYSSMSNFKSHVLHPSIDEINEKTDLTIKYEQFKSGRTIVGFSFTITVKNIHDEVYQRKRITIAEAIKLSQTEIKGGYIGESERDALARVMNHKDDDGRNVYLILTSRKDWIEYRKLKKQKIKKREQEADTNKWITIGNTRVDDELIDKNLVKGETREDCRNRIIAMLKAEIQNAIDDDSIPEHVRYYQSNNN